MSTSTFDKTCNACHEAGLTCIKRKFSGEPCERCSQLDHSCIWSQKETGSNRISTLDSVGSFASPAPIFGHYYSLKKYQTAHLAIMIHASVSRYASDGPSLTKPNASPSSTEYSRQWPKYALSKTCLLCRSKKIRCEHGYQERTLLEASQESVTITPTPECLRMGSGMSSTRNRNQRTALIQAIQKSVDTSPKTDVNNKRIAKRLCACIAANGWRRVRCDPADIHCQKETKYDSKHKSVKNGSPTSQELSGVENASKSIESHPVSQEARSSLDHDFLSALEIPGPPTSGSTDDGHESHPSTNSHLGIQGLDSDPGDGNAIPCASPAIDVFHDPDITFTPMSGVVIGSIMPPSLYQRVPANSSDVISHPGPVFSDSPFDISSVSPVSQSPNANVALFLDSLSPSVSVTSAHTLSTSNENQGIVNPAQLDHTWKDSPGDSLMGGAYRATDDPRPYHSNDPLDVFYNLDLGRTMTPTQNSMDWTFESSYQRADTIPRADMTDNEASTIFIPVLGSLLMDGGVEHPDSQGECPLDSILRITATPDDKMREFNSGSLGSRSESNDLRLYPHGRVQNLPHSTSSNLWANEGESSLAIDDGLDVASQSLQSIVSTPTFLFSPHHLAFDISQPPLDHQYTSDDFISSPYFTPTPLDLSQLQYFGHDLDESSSPASLQVKPATSALNSFITKEIGGGTVNPSQLHAPLQGISMHNHEPGIAGQGLHHPDHALADVSGQTNGDDEASAWAERVSLTSSDVFPNFGPLIASTSATVSPPITSAVLNTSPVHHLGEIHNSSRFSVHSDSVNQTKTTMAEEMPESESDHGPSQRQRTSKTSTFHPYKRHSDFRKSMVGTPRSSVENSTIDHNFLDNAFSATSRYPDPILHRLLLAVRQSQFYLCDQLEPILGSQEAERLLAQIETDSCKFVVGRDKAGKSTLSVFIDTTSVSCLMCGKAKGSLERALGCVRAHLGYRPFWCSGASVGCKTCTTIEFKRFYSQSLLNDHLSRQASKPTCDACGKSFCRGNIARHWRAKHSEIPFPSDLYPRYKQGSNQPSEADKPTPISDSGYSSA